MDDLFDEMEAPPEDAGLELPPAVPEVMPAGFTLAVLPTFVADVRLRVALDTVVADVLAMPCTGAEAMVALDRRLDDVRGAMAVIEAAFEEPKRLAHERHKAITSTLAEWINPGISAVIAVAARLNAERRRLDALAEDTRRANQARADADARANVERAAAAAAATGAPAAVVENLQKQAAVATAPPVRPIGGAPTLGTSTPTTKKKVRLIGTPATADDETRKVKTKDMTTEQNASAIQLMKACIDGRVPLSVFKELDWTYLDKRADNEGATFAIPGLETYESDGLRAKPSKRS